MRGLDRRQCARMIGVPNDGRSYGGCVYFFRVCFSTRTYRISTLDSLRGVIEIARRCYKWTWFDTGPTRRAYRTAWCETRSFGEWDPVNRRVWGVSAWRHRPRCARGAFATTGMARTMIWRVENACLNGNNENRTESTRQRRREHRYKLLLTSKWKTPLPKRSKCRLLDRDVVNMVFTVNKV